MPKLMHLTSNLHVVPIHIDAHPAVDVSISCVPTTYIAFLYDIHDLLVRTRQRNSKFGIYCSSNSIMNRSLSVKEMGIVTSITPGAASAVEGEIASGTISSLPKEQAFIWLTKFSGR